MSWMCSSLGCWLTVPANLSTNMALDGLRSGNLHMTCFIGRVGGVVARASNLDDCRKIGELYSLWLVPVEGERWFLHVEYATRLGIGTLRRSQQRENPL
jgi:hypothetical protein